MTLARTVGRNQPCPCDSGKKNKDCHNRKHYSQEDVLGFILQNRAGVTIANKKTGEVYCAGGPGISIQGFVSYKGDFESVEKEPQSHDSLIQVDLPLYLPIQDVELALPDGVVGYEAHLQILDRRRGEEQFNMDVSHLPTFTHLAIFVRSGLVSADRAPPPNGAIVSEPERVIRNVLAYLKGPFAATIGVDLSALGDVRELAFVVDYYRKGEQLSQERPAIARATYPFTGVIRVPDRRSAVAVTEEHRRALAQARAELFVLAQRDKSAHLRLAFRDQVLMVLEKFVFYVRQHAGTLGQLDEPEIRDLCLIPFKVLYGHCEAEAFHYTGKTDIKITDPNNAFTFGVAEFKKYDGLSSLNAVYSQLVKEHSTGQESFLYMVLISDRKNLEHVEATVRTFLADQPEIVQPIPNAYVGASREALFECIVVRRQRRIPMVVGIIDVHYDNPRGH